MIADSLLKLAAQDVIFNDINKYKFERERLMKKRRQIGIAISIQKIKLIELVFILKSLNKTNPRRTIWKLNRQNRFFETDLFTNKIIFFKQNIRINQNSFDDLCKLLPNLAKESTHFRETIPVKKRVAVALYALGSSSEYRTIANLFGIGKSTVCEIVLDFCAEVWEQLSHLYINAYPLTDVTIKRNINGFENLGFPQCIGAIDGCHFLPSIPPHL